MRRFLLTAALACAAFSGTATAADGALDPSFGTDAEFPGYGFYANPNGTPNFSLDWVGGVLQRPDGKIWVVGRMRAPTIYRLSLYRVGANGYPDTEFGTLGLRTVVGPCADFNVGNAVLDAQGRVVVAITGCPDFMVYRFLPNGDLDTSLAGSGVLTVPFDQGGANADSSQHVAVAANGDIVIAGTVTTAGTTNLGIARYTDAGLPAAGFGTTGKVLLPFEWSVPEVRGVNGLHLTADGRIVVPGAISQTSQAVSDKKQFVVRLLANGTLDPAYGNSSAGISKINLKAPLGVVESPWSYASMLESDGAVIQVGKIQSNQVNSDGDIFLLRWRADGQLDTSIGTSGVRQYALDFAGPNPAEPSDNWESANAIVRQANGSYLITATCYQGDYVATGLLRLKRNFSVDTSFGNGGKIRHAVQVSTTGQHGQSVGDVLLQRGRIVIGGTAFTGINGRIQMMMGLQHDEIFANTFE